MSQRIFSKQVHPQLATSWREQVLRPLRDDDRSNDREHDVLRRPPLGRPHGFRRLQTGNPLSKRRTRLEACQTYFLPGENFKLK
jgi:hypothetical protein